MFGCHFYGISVIMVMVVIVPVVVFVFKAGDFHQLLFPPFKTGAKEYFRVSGDRKTIQLPLYGLFNTHGFLVNGEGILQQRVYILARITTGTQAEEHCYQNGR
jgi:hypothetical protein